MTISISKLKRNICELLDHILETFESLKIKWKRKRVTLMPSPSEDRLKNLRRRKVMACDPEELVHLEWLEK